MAAHGERQRLTRPQRPDRGRVAVDGVATLPQRRMTDARERQLVLRQLKEAELDPNDERAGYLHAVCAISRPDPSLRLFRC